MQITPRNRVARGPASPKMGERIAKMRALIERGYTVLEAGRILGLSRNTAQDTARRFGLRALPGPIGEAKSMAGIRGNAIRWGGAA